LSKIQEAHLLVSPFPQNLGLKPNWVFSIGAVGAASELNPLKFEEKGKWLSFAVMGLRV
jgi:hypothetical protein